MYEYYKNKKILITGGLGFIGSNLAIKLVSAGADVLLVDSMIPAYGGNIFNIDPIKNKVRINYSDIRDSTSMNYLVRNIDVIFNLAGTLSHVDSMTDPLIDLEINCKAQLSLLESVRKYNAGAKIVFAGTRNQYGKAKYLPVDENHPLDPTDVNGINNIAAEKYHLLYNKVYGIKTVSVRMTNTYGPRHQMKHPRQGVLNWFIRQILDRQKIYLFGDGKQIRDVNYIDDVVSALMVIAESRNGWGEAYNLGGTSVSLADFVNEVIRINGSGSFTIQKFPKDREIIEVGDYIASYEKIKKTYGWKPKVSIKAGIAETVKYYIKNKSYYWGK
jgi:UDP-glucose 4-epimerase